MSNEPEQKPEGETPETPESPQPPPAAGQPPAPEPEPAQAAPTPGGQIPGTEKKLVSGILGILLGSLGVHKFYLGYTVEGIIMLAVFIVGWFLCGIPSMAVAAVGLIEGILYLTKTDDEFVKTYVNGRKGWF